MASTSLSPNRAMQRMLKHRAAIATLARQAAIKAVKHRLRADGLKLHDFSAKDIAVLADKYLAEHRARLIEDAEEVIATSPLFARWRLPPVQAVFVKSTEIEHSPNPNSAVTGEIFNG
jgi:hypothetical protein